MIYQFGIPIYNTNALMLVEPTREEFDELLSNEVNRNKLTDEELQEIFKELDDIAPDLSRFVIEYPYFEIYTREEVDLKTREICTVSALTALGTIPQLKEHINAALNVGNSPTEIVEIMMQMSAYCGFPKAINAVMAAKEVFIERDLL